MIADQLANLDDDEARQLKGHVHEFYKRVLILMNETGCSTALAIQAIEQAEAGEGE